MARLRGSTMLPVVVRGLRARALLSAGSMLLIAVALGSAVLAPIFQSASTNSYLVSRLNDEPNNLTGLSWLWKSTDGQSRTPASGSRPPSRTRTPGRTCRSGPRWASSRLSASRPSPTAPRPVRRRC